MTTDDPANDADGPTDEPADHADESAVDTDESVDVDWPVKLRGVTESVVTTLGPNERWNVATLGLHEPTSPETPVRAVTFGNTRTRRNFHRESGGYVQFTTDPVLYVDAALSVHEQDDPVLASADAWVRVEVEHVDTDESGGTTLEHWHLRPVEAETVHEYVPTTNRGYNAVVEATVAASRLSVEEYDTGMLRERLEHLEGICRTCGGEREQAAFDRLNELVDR